MGFLLIIFGFGIQVGAQREYSAGGEDESRVSDATNQEAFSWSSVILP